MTDTIYALSSAPGKAGVSVVRVSGDKAWTSLQTLTQLPDSPNPRAALFKKLVHPQSGEILDRALIIPFKGPASFTGEDVVEYHLHGSIAVVHAFLSALGTFDGHRLADPGEFTRRAFENGKLDLTEAEAIGDLINAETEAQRLQALAQMDGALSTLYNGWREELVKALAYIEAIIDFPDEDVPDTETAKARPAIEKIERAIGSHLNDNNRGERLRGGIHVAIIGAPNAGKSSLINALAQRDVAIVSPFAGTTRDIIEVHLDLGGYPVIVADTAGLRPDQITEDSGHGSIESEGIRRALNRAENADIRLLVFDGTAKDADQHTLSLIDDKSIVLINKLDLCHSEGATRLKNLIQSHLALGSFADAKNATSSNSHPRGDAQHHTHSGNPESAGAPAPANTPPVIELSTTSGQGLDQLLAALTEKIQAAFAVSRETPSLTRARHRAALEDCRAHLQSALEAALPELMAEDLRLAARALGRITGRVDVEDLLDVIFRDFCIGK